MKCLVTGGAGFIGSHVVDALTKAGHEVIIIDNLFTGNFTNIHSGCFVKRDITSSIEEVFAKYKFDCVFHLAAQINLRHSIKDPLNDANINIIGSLNVLNNCVKYGIKRIIFSSTGGAIYSPEASLPCTETSEAKPESPYGLAKQTVENYLEFYRKSFGLSYTILRYSNVYGPRQNAKGEAGVISIFIDNALQNKNLHIFGNGNQTRDFIYVDDVVQANMVAMNSQLDGIYNVSTNTQTSVNEIADKIMVLTDTRGTVEYDTPIAGELLHTQLSSDKLQTHGWKPTWNLDDGMKSTINFFK